MQFERLNDEYKCLINERDSLNKQRDNIIEQQSSLSKQRGNIIEQQGSLSKQRAFIIEKQSKLSKERDNLSNLINEYNVEHLTALKNKDFDLLKIIEVNKFN